VPGCSLRAAFEGGRRLQRLWLTATRLGLSLHPMSGLPYMLAQDERDPAWFSPVQRARLAGVRDGFRRLFPTPAGDTELLLFRLLRAEPPSARSLRRPLEAVLEFA
jgi:hypothetical protein